VHRQSRDSVVRCVLWTGFVSGWCLLAVAFPDLRHLQWMCNLGIVLACASGATAVLRWGFRRRADRAAIPITSSAALMRRVRDNSIVSSEALDRVTNCEMRLDAYNAGLVCAFQAAGKPVPPGIGADKPDLHIVKGDASGS
jgi:hypothetical protein